MELTTTNNPLDRFTRIEYKGQLVIPTATLAEIYETTVNNLQVNFRNNRERFIEEKHFFRVEGDNLKTFRDCLKNFQTVVTPRTSVLYLWTKRGCMRHCKSIGTDRAWEAFELLEDTYFNQLSTQEKPLVSLTDFERGKELAHLAAHTKDPYKRERLVAKAANLLLGEEFLQVPNLTPVVQMTLFK